METFSVLQDNRVRHVLERMHRESDQQNLGLIWHYLPNLPRLLLGGRIRFSEKDILGYYSDKFLALDRKQAAFCYLTARSIGAQNIVEFGSSFGISSIWLAAAIRDNGGGKLIGTELVAAKAQKARTYIEEAGLSEFIEIREGDARETLQDLDEPVDMLLNDGFPLLALEILKLVAPNMRRGSVVLTDNVGMFRANYKEYLQYMRSPASGFSTLTLPFKSGTEYSVKL